MPMRIGVQPLRLPRRRLSLLNQDSSDPGPPGFDVRTGLMLEAPPVPTDTFGDDRNPPEPAIETPKTDHFSTALKLLAPILGLIAGGKKGLAYGTQFSTGFIDEQRRQKEEEKKDEQRRQDEADRQRRRGLLESEDTRATERAARETEKAKTDAVEKEVERKVKAYEAAKAARKWDDADRLGLEIWGVSGRGQADKGDWERALEKEKVEQDYKKALAQNARETVREKPVDPKANILTGQKTTISPTGEELSEKVFFRLNADGTISPLTVRDGLQPPPPPPPPPFAGSPVPAITVRDGFTRQPVTSRPTAAPWVWATDEVKKKLGAKELYYSQPGQQAPKPFNEKAVRVLIAKKPTWSDERVDLAVAKLMRNGMSSEDAVRWLADDNGILH